MKDTKRIRRLVLPYIVLLAMLAGCAVFAPKERPGLAGLPSHFSMYSEHGEQGEAWWKNFNSEELNGLMQEALTNNFSIREAAARLTQASSVARKTGAGKFPELSAQAGATRSEYSSEGEDRLSTEEWSLGLAASFELDLWGRVRSETTSSELLAAASAEDMRAAMITVSGQIAENWISLVANRQQQELLTSELELQQQLLELIKLRFPLAKSTALDIYQQEQAIEQIKAALIPLASQEGVLKRQLALLVGKSALAEEMLDQEAFPAIGRIPAVGLPADLLASRPDIRAAGFKLKSADWEVSAAKADRLPALKLTASHTYLAQETSAIFDNWLLNLAANLTGPVFDAGRRRAEVVRTKALAEERLVTYANTVFIAIKEVEDALADESRYEQSLTSLKRQLAISEKTIREARRRYLNGSSDFLNVLREELNIQQVRQDIIATEENKLVARTRLYRALGGSWMDSYLE